MKEKPILFSGPMVRAILNGTKTQTRRVIKPQPIDAFPILPTLKNPYAGVQRLWVRETWQSLDLLTEGRRNEGPCYKATAHHVNCKCPGHLWRPSIFMPRKLCRIFLDVVQVRVERLQQISQSDAQSEGVLPHWEAAELGFRQGFEVLWDSINAARGFSWESNPWVFAITFTRVEAAMMNDGHPGRVSSSRNGAGKNAPPTLSLL